MVTRGLEVMHIVPHLNEEELGAQGTRLLKLLNAVGSKIRGDIKRHKVMSIVSHINEVCHSLLDFKVISKLCRITRLQMNWSMNIIITRRRAALQWHI